MNTQIAQITQSLAANGCAYITPSDALYDEQDWELMNQVLANSTLPWEKILIGDADEENDLYVARFMTDRDRPTVVNHALSELIIPRVCNDNVMSLFRKLMGDDAFYVRRMQVNRMKAGSFIGRHLDTDSNPTTSTPSSCSSAPTSPAASSWSTTATATCATTSSRSRAR